MGLNYITCTSIKKHQHFHSHLIFILQIHFVSINGYRCDKYLDLQKIKNTFQECLQHVHTVTHECLQLIFPRWIKQRPVINDIRGSQNTNDVPRNFNLMNLASMNAKFIWILYLTKRWFLFQLNICRNTI